MSRLHWYGPRSYPDRWHAGVQPLRRARYKLAVSPEHTKLRDRHGPYVWMGTDCGWEWLGTRPGIWHIRPLRLLFERLHEHVHTPGSW